MTYSPGQALKLINLFPKGYVPEWLLLGGPADGNEAQTFRNRYPTIRTLAVEPSWEMVAWQLANDFPEPALLIEAALADREGTATLRVPPDTARRASLVRPVGGEEREVAATTLDALARRYGPFRRAVLWMDIEGAELAALRGAEALLTAGCIDWVNVEVAPEERPEDTAAISTLMARHHFVLVDHWNPNNCGTPSAHEDRIYASRRVYG